MLSMIIIHQRFKIPKYRMLFLYELCYLWCFWFSSFVNGSILNSERAWQRKRKEARFNSNLVKFILLLKLPNTTISNNIIIISIIMPAMGFWSFVMDDASMHKIDIVKDKIKECKTKISIIPGGLTRYLQPLDLSINKPFKDELKKRYNKFV